MISPRKAPSFGVAVRNARRATNGFTLLELLCVLAILSLATLAASLAVRGNTRLEVRAIAQDVASDLRRSREDAVLHQQATALRLKDVEQHLHASRGRRRMVPNLAIEFQAGRPSLVDQAPKFIRFFPDGSSTGGAFKLQSGRETVIIRIDWIDGQVAIEG
jgi:general secretion pathway protein H